MNRFALTAICAIALTPALWAAEGTVLRKDGSTTPFRSIEAETLSGIEWKDANRQPGSRIDIWDVEQVRYTLNGMDQFNGLTKKLQAGRGDALEKDAQGYLDNPPKGLTDEGDKLRVKLCSLYFVARGKLLQGMFADAAVSFLAYLKEAEAASALGPNKPNIPSNPVRGVAFASPTGAAVKEAGALHRLYLDALEGLGDALARDGKNDEAFSKGYGKLEELTLALNAKSARAEYIDWSIRALRAAGALAESSKDGVKRAREIYEKLSSAALKRNGGRPSRDSIQASLKVGFLLVQEGNPTGAQSRFSAPIREWEAEQKSVKSPPKNNWITQDAAYQVCGSYLGMGMVRSANAKTSEDWALALQSYSNSLSVFAGDADFRSLALLGAANACVEMAKLTKDKEVAKRHAESAERYMFELRTTLGNSNAANDPKVAEITKAVDRYKS
ncbi:MAG: hypothetical protein DPW14_08505 [Planctomycetes bacterium]|nr:hypothetical protein [Planctomycetota bacterium]